MNWAAFARLTGTNFRDESSGLISWCKVDEAWLSEACQLYNKQIRHLKIKTCNQTQVATHKSPSISPSRCTLKLLSKEQSTELTSNLKPHNPDQTPVARAVCHWTNQVGGGWHASLSVKVSWLISWFEVDNWVGKWSCCYFCGVDWVDHGWMLHILLCMCTLHALCMDTQAHAALFFFPDFNWHNFTSRLPSIFEPRIEILMAMMVQIGETKTQRINRWMVCSEHNLKWYDIYYTWIMASSATCSFIASDEAVRACWLRTRQKLI